MGSAIHDAHIVHSSSGAKDDSRFNDVIFGSHYKPQDISGGLYQRGYNVASNDSWCGVPDASSEACKDIPTVSDLFWNGPYGTVAAINIVTDSL